MNSHDETYEEKRERLRQSEIKNNPTGTLHDSSNQGRLSQAVFFIFLMVQTFEIINP